MKEHLYNIELNEIHWSDKITWTYNFLFNNWQMCHVEDLNFQLENYKGLNVCLVFSWNVFTNIFDFTYSVWKYDLIFIGEKYLGKNSSLNRMPTVYKII